MAIEIWKKTGEQKQRLGFRKIISKTFVTHQGKETVFDCKDEGQAVCIVAFTEEEKVIMAKQFRVGVEKVLMELPGGAVDAEETPLDAAKRELLEETGYEPDTIEIVGESYDCAYSTMVRTTFVAKGCKKVAEQDLDSEENIEIVLLSLQEFRTLLRSGAMTDVECGYLALDHLNLL